MTLGSITRSCFILVTLSLLLFSTIEASRFSANSPFSPRWTFDATNPAAILGSASLPLGAYSDGRFIYGFSLDDGSQLWQVNQSIEYKNETYAPSLNYGFIIEGNPPQVLVDYSLQVQMGLYIYQWRGFYLWDLKTGKFNLDDAVDPYAYSDAAVMVTPQDVYMVQYGRPTNTLYLLKGPEYSLKTPAASYSWPTNGVYLSYPPLTFLQSTQKLLLFVAYSETNASLSRLDASNAKQTGKIDLTWQAEIGYSAPNFIPSKDESKMYGSYAPSGSGSATIFRLDLETGKFDWQRQISWPAPKEATYVFVGLSVEVVDQSTGSQLPCGFAAVYLPNQQVDRFAFCVDPSSGNYVFNVSMPTNGLVFGSFNQWLMVYDYVSTLVAYDPFQQVAEGEEPQPGWKISIPGLNSLTYPVGKDPKYVIVSSRTGLSRWDIVTP